MRPAPRNQSKGIDEDDTDFAYDDLRLARRWKRRRLGFNPSCNPSRVRVPNKIIDNNGNNGVCKEDAVVFELVSCSSKVPEETIKYNNEDERKGEGHTGDNDYIGNENSGGGDGDFDPHYMMFLGKLKVYQKSYMLELPLNAEVSVFLKYEMDEGSCDGHKSDDLGAKEICPKTENTENQRILRSVSKRIKTESLEILKDVQGRKKFESPRTLRSGSRKESMKTMEHSCDVPRRKRTSEMAKKNIKAEVADPVFCRTNEGCFTRSRPNNSHSVNERHRTLLSCQTKAFKKNAKVEAAGPNHCKKKNARSTRRPSLDTPFSAKHDLSPKMKCDMVDESYLVYLNSLETDRQMKCDMVDATYLKFLNCLKKDGKDIVLIDESGKKVIYEEDVESESDLEVIAMDHDPFFGGNYTPFIVSKSYDSLMAEPLSSSQSEFREKLMNILRMPYNKKEHKDLWELVSYRKPKGRHREFRGGRERSCSLKSPGKSYLDHHKELAKKIDLAGRDHLKILNLLRGFIYWLQYCRYVCREVESLPLP
ncbi:hypothetical protein CFOL_v3_25107, partial [Cephalotus follicularis]